MSESCTSSNANHSARRAAWRRRQRRRRRRRRSAKRSAKSSPMKSSASRRRLHRLVRLHHAGDRFAVMRDARRTGSTREGVGETEVRTFPGPAACRAMGKRGAERFRASPPATIAGWVRASEISPTPSAFFGHASFRHASLRPDPIRRCAGCGRSDESDPQDAGRINSG